MILGEKIMNLRKKNGWSQEELANQLNVSRQAVSKWESVQSTPDLDKILLMSQIFGVSTDYLIKDDMEIEDYAQEPVVTSQSVLHQVSMEEAVDFLDKKAQSAKTIAIGVFLCVISPITLLFVGALSEQPASRITENQAGGIGITVLMILVAIAVLLFMLTGAKTKQYEFLENEMIETAYGVTGMVKQRKEAYQSTYVLYTTIGVMFCVLSVVPLFVALIFTESELAMVEMICLLLLFVAVGCIFLCIAGIQHSSFQILLQEGDYTQKGKKNDKKVGAVASVFWPMVTAGYLCYSFVTNDWQRSWIVWPVAGVLFGAIAALVKVLADKEE